MPRSSTQTEYRLELWQDGVQIDTVTGTDFAVVHPRATSLALLHGEEDLVEIRGVPEDKWHEVMALLGCATH